MKELRDKIRKYNSIDPVKVGLVVTVLYAVLLILVSIVHEPWYDEAQAWQIAKEASYHDILFYLPHYESHPPLWHLILSVPAKLGLPYEASIKTVTILFSVLGICLIEFKSGFTNWVKTFMPFNFFLFYQFGVISRPYSMMLFALLLCALFFEKRDEKPVRFFLSLGFLCLTSDYGLVIAGGITIGWIADIIVSKKKGALREIFCGNIPRLAGYILLALLALALILAVWPSSDTTVIPDTPVWYKFYMFLLVAPAEAFMTDFLSGIGLGDPVDGPVGGIVASMVSIIIWTIAITGAARRKSLHHLIFPVLTFVMIGAFYSAPHHYGIYVMLFIYFFWILRNRPSRDVKLGSGVTARITKIVPLAMMVIAMSVSMYWSLTSSLNEVVFPYYYSRELAGWLKENTKEEDVVMASWHPVYEKDGNGQDDKKKLAGVNFKSVAEILVPTRPYFDYDVIDNELMPYQWLGALPTDVRDGYIADVKEMGSPDYVITYNTDFIPGFLAAIDCDEDYDLAMVFFNRRIYKDNTYPYNVMVFKKK